MIPEENEAVHEAMERATMQRAAIQRAKRFYVWMGFLPGLVTGVLFTLGAVLKSSGLIAWLMVLAPFWCFFQSGISALHIPGHEHALSGDRLAGYRVKWFLLFLIGNYFTGIVLGNVGCETLGEGFSLL